MTENNPEDLSAQFRLDQQAAKDEESTRDAIVWSQRVEDAETTLAQRRAVTRRINAASSLMEGLNTVLWLLIVLSIVGGLSWAVASIFQAFQ